MEKAIIELGKDAYECARRKAQLEAFSVTQTSGGKKRKEDDRYNNQSWRKRKPTWGNGPDTRQRDPKRRRRDDGKDEVVCYKCGETGHKANRCWNKPQDVEESSKADGEESKQAQGGDKEQCILKIFLAEPWASI